MNTQVNIAIPTEWKEHLDTLARKQAYEKNQDVTYLDVIRNAIREHCHLLDRDEIEKCKNDYIYFIENYVKIRSIDEFTNTIIPFKLYDYQKRYLKHIHENKHSIAVKFRQGGFSSCNIFYALWKAMFHTGQKIEFISVRNRDALILSRLIDFTISYMSNAVKPILTTSNGHEKKFESGSSITFRTPAAAKGTMIDHLFIDEAAFIHNMDECFKSVYPCISAEAKLTIVSTQNGLGWFSKILRESEEGKNTFKPFTCSYKEHLQTRKAIG